MSIFQDFRSQAKSSLAPGTVGITIALVASFLIAFLHLAPIGEKLSFFTDFTQPWGLLTYPFAWVGDTGAILWLVIEILWLWGMGGSIERELGTPKYLAMFF